MEGVHYLTDQRGRKKAVVIDLKKYKEEVEDFLDGLEASSRAHEPSVDFKKSVSKILSTKRKGKNVVPSQNKKVG